VNWVREGKSHAWIPGLPSDRFVLKIRFFKLCFVSYRSAVVF